jgi:hypothetical protein
MKKTFTILCAITILQQHGFAQNQQPYTFPANGWNVEKATFPLSFAPGIPYKGNDEIRFMPGFENAVNNNYFSYCFLWYLDGNIKFSAAELENDFKLYYNGLCHLNDGTTVTVTKLTPATKYKQAFKYVIQTTDNLYTHRSITLNGTVNITACNSGNNTLVFFEITPKPFGDGVWKELDAVRDGVGWSK